MTNDSVTQLVKYQRTIGALPQGAGLSVRTHWGGPLGGMGGSVRKYVAGYKGVTTYKKLLGLQDAAGLITGVLPDLFNGRNADDASQSASWNAIMTGIQGAYNAANNAGAGISMDSFTISSPASNVPDLATAIGVVGQLVGEALRTNSVTASGQFQLDIKIGNHPINPGGVLDPRPVFDWSITISVDNSAESMTLTIDVKFDHMAQNLLGDIAGIFAGLLTAGFDLGAGIATGFEVGQIVDAKYNASANSGLLNALAGPLVQLTWVVQPFVFQFDRRSTTEFAVSVTYQFDSSTWNALANLINNPTSVPQQALQLKVLV